MPETIQQLIKQLEMSEIYNVVNSCIEGDDPSLIERSKVESTSKLRAIFYILAKDAGYGFRNIGTFMDGRNHGGIVRNTQLAREALSIDNEFKALYNRVADKLMQTYAYKLSQQEKP